MIFFFFKVKNPSPAGYIKQEKREKAARRIQERVHHILRDKHRLALQHLFQHGPKLERFQHIRMNFP